MITITKMHNRKKEAKLARKPHNGDEIAQKHEKVHDKKKTKKKGVQMRIVCLFSFPNLPIKKNIKKIKKKNSKQEI